jgi:CIC family chloride channel protein
MLCSKLLPNLAINPSAFVLVGMGGFFAGVAKVPIASLILVAEMTGGYSLIVPLLIVSSISYVLLGEYSLYEKQVSTRVDSPAHLGDFAVNILEHIPVKNALPADRKVTMIPQNMTLDRIIHIITNSNQMNFPVVDEKSRLNGILSLADIRKVMLYKEMHRLVVAKDIAVTGVLTVTPEDSLYSVLQKMTEADIRELPVVSTEDSKKVISMVGRKDLIRTYHNEIEKTNNIRAARPMM